jgi:hypothetical protein
MTTADAPERPALSDLYIRSESVNGKYPTADPKNELRIKK